MIDLFASQKTLFRLFNIDFKITPRSWRMLIAWMAVGLVVALIVFRSEPLLSRLGWGVLYGLLALVSYVAVHLTGHILSAYSVNAPMSLIVINGLRAYTLYDDAPDTDIPSKIHLVRSIGGPLANLLLSLAAFVLWAFLGWRVLVFLGVFNLLVGLYALLPLPGIDGEVIWRELRLTRSQEKS